jgi:aspartate racemase
MKRIGIVGGIGPESTIDYYRLFMAARYTDVTIDSLDVQKLLEWMPRGELDTVAEYLAAAVARLAAGGAEIALFAANTPHIVFDRVAPRAPIPMVSIVEATCAHVASLGFHRAALLGTRYTMEGQFYPEVFARRGMSLVVPPEPDRSLVHDRYINELLKNVFKDETRDELLGVVERLVRQQGVEAVILGGTELPLILRGESHAGAVLIDTTKVHVQAALAAAND